MPAITRPPSKAATPAIRNQSAGDDHRQAGDEARGVLREFGFREMDLLLEKQSRVASEVRKQFAE